MEIDVDTANDTNVYVLDSNGAKVPITVGFSNDSVFVNSPEGEYNPGDYTLYITRGVKSTTGKTLNCGVKMKFTIVPFTVGYLKDDREAEIIEYVSSGGPVEIPREIDGLPIVAIGDSVFLKKPYLCYNS